MSHCDAYVSVFFVFSSIIYMTFSNDVAAVIVFFMTFAIFNKILKDPVRICTYHCIDDVLNVQVLYFFLNRKKTEMVQPAAVEDPFRPQGTGALHHRKGPRPCSLESF